MTTPSELYRAGRLDEAVQESLILVKKHPSDTALRFQLAEFACIAGDLERADRQLDTLATQEPKTAITAALLRQLIRAETSRRECFYEGRVPEFIGKPSPRVETRLKALTLLRANDAAEASSLIGSAGDAEFKTANTTWVVNDKPCDAIRDLDDLLTPILEVHTSTGKYFWIDWTQIIYLVVHPPKRSLDLLWRQATLSIENGPEGEVYLPAIYIDPPGVAADATLQLGRSTDWIEVADSLCRGRGQKTLLIGDDDLPIMELQTIERQE